MEGLDSTAGYAMRSCISNCISAPECESEERVGLHRARQDYVLPDREELTRVTPLIEQRLESIIDEVYARTRMQPHTQRRPVQTLPPRDTHCRPRLPW